MRMREYRWPVRQEDNPDLVELARRRDALAEKWEDLNRRVLQLEIPKVCIWRVPKVLRQLGPELKSMEQEWADWDQDARMFCIDPKLKIPPENDGPSVTLHITAEFRSWIDRMFQNMRLLDSIYGHKLDRYRDQRNLVLSWGGILVGFIGAVLSLFSVWYALVNK
ncbi:MAG: hypothetical protein AB1792_08205 [Candidatus Zixiibacteriota bacterium]